MSEYEGKGREGDEGMKADEEEVGEFEGSHIRDQKRGVIKERRRCPKQSPTKPGGISR